MSKKAKEKLNISKAMETPIVDDKKIKEQLVSKLEEIKEKYKIDWEVMAELGDVSRATMYRYIGLSSGNVPDIKFIVKLCLRLEIPVEEVLDLKNYVS